MKNVNLKNYNTYKINCTAKEFYIPKNVEELIKILNYVKTNSLKYKILGGGSNLIFKNPIYNGVIIKLDNFNHLKIIKNNITVGSGYNLIKLSIDAAHNNLSGLEFAAGIPGTVGGAIYNNAGAYGKCLDDLITSVKVITPNLEIKTFSDFSYEYRTSFFKENENYIILEATLQLKPGNKSEILNTISEYRKKRYNTQPLDFPSAGSVFRNPINYSAGKLIEDAGLKGTSIGGAKISEKHANFIINNGNANGQNIVELISKVQTTIKDKYNIDLILEQEIVE